MLRVLPIVVTFLLGVLLILEFFVPHHAVHDLTVVFQEWGLVLTAAAFILGGVNLLQVNLSKIRRREADWGYRVVLVGSAAGTLLAALLGGGDEAPAYVWLYEHVFAPANSTMFALLAFYIASAAFRAFRARNAESALMLTAAVIVMVSVIPLGDWLAEASGHPDAATGLRSWILDYASNAGRRAILVGAALGGIATALRVLLGLERSHLGGD